MADAVFIIATTADVASSNAAAAGVAPRNVMTVPEINSDVLTDGSIDNPAPAPESPDRIYTLVVGWVRSNVSNNSRLIINPGSTHSHTPTKLRRLRVTAALGMPPVKFDIYLNVPGIAVLAEPSEPFIARGPRSLRSGNHQGAVGTRGHQE